MRHLTILCLGILATAAWGQPQATTAPTPAPSTTAVPARGSIAIGQQRVDPGTTYHRVLAIVPIVGSGTFADPKRPMFAPTPQAAATRSGIIGYQHLPSDDGKFALVEFVAVNRSAFAELFASTDPGVKYFEVGKASAADIQAAFQQKKASFSLSAFRPMPVQ